MIVFIRVVLLFPFHLADIGHAGPVINLNELKGHT